MTSRIGWIIVSLIALLASIAWHFDHPLTRSVAAAALEDFVSGEIRGSLEIGHVEVMNSERIVVHDARLYDPYGRLVIRGDEIVLVPDLDAAFRNRLRFESARLRGGEVVLVEGDDATPTLIEAFEPSRPSSGTGPSLHAIVDGIHVEDVIVRGELLGLEGLRAEGMTADGRIEAMPNGEVEILVTSASSTVTRPFPFTGHVETLEARIHTDPSIGFELAAGGRVEREHGPTDHVSVGLTYRRPEGAHLEEGQHAPQELALRVDADPADARLLRELGFDWAETLQGGMAGTFRLEGVPGRELALSFDAETDGGPVHVAGRLPAEGDVVIEATTTGVDLDRIVRNAPEIRVAGEARMTIAETDEEEPPEIHLDLQPFVYDRWAVPALTIDGELHEDYVAIERVEAPYSGGRIRGHGEVGFDGRVDLVVRGSIPELSRDPNIRRILPDAHGSVVVDARLRTFGEERPGLDFRGTITLRHVRYGPLTADVLVLSGSARGSMERPRVALAVDGTNVAVSEYPFGTAHLRLDGGPSQYAVSGSLATATDRILLEARIGHEGRVFTLDTDQLEYTFRGEAWRGGARGVVLDPDRTLDVERFTLASGSQRLEAWGRWGFDGPENFEVLLQDFDITALRAIVGPAVPEIGGRADTHVAVRGDISRPNLLVEGALRGGRIRGVDEINAFYVVQYTEDGNLSYDAQVDLDERGAATVRGTGLLDPSIPDPFAALEGGVYDAEIDFAGLEIDVIRRVSEEALAGADGRVTGEIRISGPTFAPKIDANLTIPDLALEPLPPLDVTTRVAYDSGVLQGRLETSDDRGPLVEVEGTVLIDFIQLLTNPEEALETLDTLPWRVSTRFESRRLDALPEELSGFVPDGLGPLRVALTATMAGGGFPTRGYVFADLAWEGPLEDPLCNGSAGLRAQVNAEVLEDQATVQTRIFAGPDRIGTIDASAPVPVQSWISGAVTPALVPTSINAFLENAPAARVPWLCRYAEGPLTAQLEVRDLFTDAPRARLEAHTSALTLVDTQPVRADLLATIEPGMAELDTNVAWWSGERATIAARVPVAWTASELFPRVSDEDLAISADFESAPLGPFITWMPQVAFAAGHLTGQLDARGSVADLDVQGSLALENGYIEVTSLGQHLSDVAGRIRFNGNWIQLEGVRARDGDGTLRVDGGVGLDGFLPSRVRLAVHGNEFPVRSEGSILAALTGNATVEGTIEPEQTDLNVTVRALGVELPDDAARTVQELEAHPDVHFAGEDAEHDRAREAAYPIVVNIDASRPFWVRRTDFATQVTANLRAEYRDPDLLVRGSVDLRRGFFEVFGKRFEVADGSMLFDGRRRIDPEVRLVATHDMRSPPGTQVTVTANGRLSSLEIDFRSNHRECDERAEIIAMLVSNRCGVPTDTTSEEIDADQQAVSFLAGLTAGVLTLTARKELGRVLPVIVIESGEHAFQSARIRAGFQADDYIPDFMRGFVRGAYIEGIFTAGGTDASGASSSPLPGVRLELNLPASLVLSGEVMPSGNWSGDLTLEP